MTETNPSTSATGTEHDRPRVLATTGALLLTPLGWVLDAIADAGFDAAEVVISHQRDSRSPSMVNGFAREAGLAVPVVHGPYMVVLRRVLGVEYRQKTYRSLERTAAFGAQTLVAHAPFRWERKARRWLAHGEADAAAADAGVRFAMENLFPWRGRVFSSAVTPDDLSAYPHVVFDTSHFAVAGVDLLEAWDALADRVCHIHLSDNLGAGTDSHAPIGAGVLPLERFLHHVGASGYTGTVTLELDCRPYMDTRDALVAFLARERLKAQALLAGSPYREAAALRPEINRTGWRGEVPTTSSAPALGPID